MANKLAVLSVAIILRMKQPERLSAFVDRANSSQRAFAEMGKLRHQIEKELKPNQTIFGVLRKLGVKDSTINNAGYGSRVFDLVDRGVLTEKQFDSFTFADCFTICRVTGTRSTKRLSPEDVAEVLANGGKDWDKELESIYETGMTVAEAALVATVPGASATGTAANATATGSSQTSTKSAKAGGKSSGVSAATAPTAPAAAGPGASNASTGGTAAAVPGAAQTAPPAGNVVALPAQSGKLTTADMLAKLDSLETDLIAFADTAKDAEMGPVATRLFDIAQTVAQFVTVKPAKAA